MARYLVDTNVLLRLTAAVSSQHGSAAHAVKTLLAGGHELLLCPQVVIEFWAVATRPANVNGFGWNSTDVEVEIGRLLAQFVLLFENPSVFAEWLRLVGLHGVSGKQVHDAHLATLMNVHVVADLLTFNVNDFGRYSIRSLSPDAMLAD